MYTAYCEFSCDASLAGVSQPCIQSVVSSVVMLALLESANLAYSTLIQSVVSSVVMQALLESANLAYSTLIQWNSFSLKASPVYVCTWYMYII